MVFWRPLFRSTAMTEYEFDGFWPCGYGALSESLAAAGIDGQLPARRDALALAAVRSGIDRIDDALLLLLAGRSVLARRTRRLKALAGLPPRDPPREARVHRRAQRLAHRVGLPAATAHALIDVAIGEACRRQGQAKRRGRMLLRRLSIRDCPGPSVADRGRP